MYLIIYLLTHIPTYYLFLCISGALRHHTLFISLPRPNEFRHSTPEELHTKRRERPLLAKDGTKTKE
jgi:hypothetical protein